MADTPELAHRLKVREHWLEREMEATFGVAPGVMREMAEILRAAGDESAILELYVPSTDAVIFPAIVHPGTARVASLALRFDARVITRPYDGTNLVSKAVVLTASRNDKGAISTVVSTIIAGQWIRSEPFRETYEDKDALRDKLAVEVDRAGYLKDFRSGYGLGEFQREIVAKRESSLLNGHLGAVRLIYPKQ